jgi:DNA-binding response OmpR family regulator
MRLLLVEDEAALRTTLAVGLREEGYVVDEAGLVREASERAALEDYDLIVLDVNLPDGNGFDACADMRRQGVKAAVLMLTARDAVRDRIQGLDSGADDYLVKPFDFDELLARLRALSRRTGSSAELRYKDLSLDPAKQRVERDGQLIALSAREYTLLEFFMHHPEEVLSRARLVQAVWPDEAGLDSNVVDVFMSYLRAKIDKPFAKPLLQTVRGMGYVLRE